MGILTIYLRDGVALTTGGVAEWQFKQIQRCVEKSRVFMVKNKDGKVVVSPKYVQAMKWEDEADG